MPKSKTTIKASDLPAGWEMGSGNIFKDLGFSDEEAASLLARCELMFQLREIIREKGWSQRKAAEELGVPQPRIAEIMKLRSEHWSIDQLVKYMDKLGRRVSFVIELKGDVA
jgi:predicted XRE-type DNA-binding protein